MKVFDVTKRINLCEENDKILNIMDKEYKFYQDICNDYVIDKYSIYISNHSSNERLFIFKKSSKYLFTTLSLSIYPIYHFQYIR